MARLTVPAKTLAIPNYSSGPVGPGDKPEKIEPMAGDPVDFHVKGSVESIDAGGNAVVKVAFINGERCEDAAAPEPEKAEAEKAKRDSEMSEEELRQMAAELDGNREDEESY